MDLRLPGVRVDRHDPRVVRLREALSETDPLADALVAWMHEVPSGRASFERAVERGIDAIDQPEPPLAAFFAEVDTPPAWLDRDLVRLGTETMLRVGAGGYAALGSVSLMSGYLASAAVKPLTATGALTRMARRRLIETSKFVLEVSLSGEVDRFSSAFRAALRVRVIHAMVRRALRRDPAWRTEAWGEPINQHDMAATNLQFSSVYVLGLLAQGYLLSRREREAVMHLWRHLGRLSGVTEALLPRSFREGLELGWIINRSEAGPDDDSRALAAALMEATGAVHRDSLGATVGGLRTRLQLGYSRFVLGRRAADALGLPDDLYRFAPLVLGPATAAVEIARCVVPGAHALSVKLGAHFAQRAIDQALEGKPAPFSAPVPA